MEDTTGKKVTFQPTELLRTKAAEIVDGAEAANYEHAIKLGGALGGVYAREHQRLTRKYGADHPRTQQAKLRLELGVDTRKALVKRRLEVLVPASGPATGWTVDGFVTAVDGRPAENVTVAVYGRAARRLDEFPVSVTDKRGFFSIVVDKLPDKEMQVYLWASLGEKLLKSNENLLSPRRGASDRIAIALEDEGRDVYKTTPNVKIDPSQMKTAPAEANAEDLKSGDEPPA